MKAKKALAKTARKLPITSGYLKKKEQAQTIKSQSDEIIGLKESVDRLETRNKEWEAEVRQLRGEPKSLEVVWPVCPKDVIEADWTKPKPPFKPKKNHPPLIINWVVPPVGEVSGGHQSILRAIDYLESKGHSCNIYIYDPDHQSSAELIAERLKKYQPVKAKVFYNKRDMAECDAIFATSWHTAYPVFNYTGNAKKYYFIQDFEPFFDPVGTYSTLAENTYKFGFRGITLGRWLSEKLSREYDMQCDYIELGYDPKEYYLINKKPRKKVLFYARPVTPRRGFELGVLSFELFHKNHPEYEINFFGWDISPFKIPFPYKNLGILSSSKLNELYNECATGLVVSFTNMSLLPVEMLATGCRPVVNDAPHTRMAGYADQLHYSLPQPAAIADSLFRVISETTESKIEEMSSFTKDFVWSTLNQSLEDILLKDLLV